MRFSVVIHKDEKSGYGVTVPDLPGCFSAGDTLEEAIESVHEAIACHLEGLLMDGEPIPECFRQHKMLPYSWRIVGRHLMVPGFLCEILRLRLRMTEGGMIGTEDHDWGSAGVHDWNRGRAYD